MSARMSAARLSPPPPRRPRCLWEMSVGYVFLYSSVNEILPYHHVFLLYIRHEDLKRERESDHRSVRWVSIHAVVVRIATCAHHDSPSCLVSIPSCVSLIYTSRGRKEREKSSICSLGFRTCRCGEDCHVRVPGFSVLSVFHTIVRFSCVYVTRT